MATESSCKLTSDDVCYSRRDAINERINSIEKALTTATKVMDRRLEGLNELRTEVTTDRDMLVKRETYDQKVDYLDRWITEANKQLTTLMLNYDSRITTVKFVAGGSFILSIISIVLMIIRIRTG